MVLSGRHFLLPTDHLDSTLNIDNLNIPPKRFQNKKLELRAAGRRILRSSPSGKRPAGRRILCSSPSGKRPAGRRILRSSPSGKRPNCVEVPAGEFYAVLRAASGSDIDSTQRGSELPKNNSPHTFSVFVMLEKSGKFRLSMFNVEWR